MSTATEWIPVGRSNHFLLLAALALSTSLAAHAGAWGDGAFDNDAAQDWLAECARSTDPAFVNQTLDMAQMASFIDADDGAAAVAAAELIAGAIGAAASTTRMVACLSGRRTEELHALAARARLALDRVADRNVSELAQQWEEERSNRWRSNLARLGLRLQR
jgi:hypothetical protein